MNRQSLDIVTDLAVPATLDSAWKAWVDNTSLEQWLTAKASVDPKTGDFYELFWQPETPRENSTLGCVVLGIEDKRLLAFNWGGPVEHAEVMNTEPFPTWVNVTFEARSDSETMIHFRHSGWGYSQQWLAARAWQERSWHMAFSQLKVLIER